MMGIQEQIPVINDRSPCCGAAGIGVPPRDICWLIHSRDKFFHCLRDRIGAAESPDDAPFRCRVLLLCHTPALDGVASRDLGPLLHVLPVPIHPQQPVQAAERVVVKFIYVLAVTADARPVHQAAGVKRRRVTVFHPDQGRCFSRRRLIFVRGCGLVQRQDDTESGRIPDMLPCAVHNCSTAQSGHPFQDIPGLPRRDVVQVKC